MDFILQLPLLNGHNLILVIVDWFSKMAIFIKSFTTATSEDLAKLVIKYVFSKHRIPRSRVSDWGSLFVFIFWAAFCKALKVRHDLSTAFHPQSDGQTEIVNQFLEQYLRMYVNYQQEDWSCWLPLAEFAYNNSTHSSTKHSPFFTFYGQNPEFVDVHIDFDSKALNYLKNLQKTQANFENNIHKANKSYKRNDDKHQLKAPALQVGNKV